MLADIVSSSRSCQCFTLPTNKLSFLGENCSIPITSYEGLLCSFFIQCRLAAVEVQQSNYIPPVNRILGLRKSQLNCTQRMICYDQRSQTIHGVWFGIHNLYAKPYPRICLVVAKVRLEHRAFPFLWAKNPEIWNFKLEATNFTQIRGERIQFFAVWPPPIKFNDTNFNSSCNMWNIYVNLLQCTLSDEKSCVVPEVTLGT